MITREHLANLKLTNPPRGQIVVAHGLLRWDYRIPRRTNITIEHEERIPHGQAVIFAMNHTDFYNYWPFMYQLYRDRGDCFISAWVKGKYYENRLMQWFLDFANNIPLPSRGYVLTKDCQTGMKRKMTHDEYRLLRDWINGAVSQEEFLGRADDELVRFVTTPHGDFDPQQQSYAEFIEAQYGALMALVARISEDALLNKNLSILVFPQGTRSTHLLPGHIGLAQIALKTRAPVIPVGCNGSDKCYRGALPFSSGGDIVYRVGEPMTMNDDLAPFAIHEPYTPFTREAETRFGIQFRGATDLIMERINDLLDPEYQFDPDAIKKQGTGRFV